MARALIMTDNAADLLAASLRAEAEARAKGDEPVPWEVVHARLAQRP